MSDPRLDIAELYDAHAERLFRFVFSLTRSEADTKDVLQEVFCRLAAKPGLLRGVTNQGAFLMKMAHRLVIDQARRQTVRSRHAAELEPAELFEETTNPDEAYFRHALAEAMAALPAEQRAVMHLKLWEKMTFEEIADALEISANTAASRYRYGIDKLRDALRPTYEDMQ